jgi:hypothetical protein
MSTERGEPPAGGEVHVEAQRPGARGRRRPPQWRMIFATGLFAATVYAATEGLLGLALDAGARTSPAAAARGAAAVVQADPASPPDAAGGTPPGSAPPPDPAQGGAPAPGTTPPAAPAPAGAPPAEGGVRGPQGADASGADGDDTNEELPAEGPRRAAPPKASDEEAPEFRESADNNISLPIDI